MKIEKPNNYEDIDFNNIDQYRASPELPGEVWVYSDTINSYFSCGQLFQVSSYGRCRKVGGSRAYAITDNGAGYKKFACTVKGVLKNYYMHRLVAQAFLPNPDSLPQVNHKQTGLGKHDNRVEHLEWCTERDNIIDAHKNGQMDYRKKVKTSIDIKPDEFVEKMYRHYKETGKVGETARKFVVPRTSLSSIVNKRSRTDITDRVDEEFDQ